ncbi:MAG TPA: hypothetical protein VGS80_24825 [Ktedonobacterales bacterium]|nr:hypothetical protein [Ktedonobacterales bacterium]
MSDEHEQRLHQPERLSHLDQELQDSTAGNLGTPWVDRMTPEERERQVEKRLPESGGIVRHG